MNEHASDKTMRQDLSKTLTFAAIHFTVGFGVAYLLTGSVAVAGGIALLEPMVNTVAFFLHERAWRVARPAAMSVGHPA